MTFNAVQCTLLCVYTDAQYTVPIYYMKLVYAVAVGMVAVPLAGLAGMAIQSGLENLLDFDERCTSLF